MCCGVSMREEELARVTANLGAAAGGGTVRGQNLLTRLFHGPLGGTQIVRGLVAGAAKMQAGSGACESQFQWINRV